MNIVEFEKRLDTVYSICCQAILSEERYRDILNDEKKFSVVFPNVDFQNPKITFKIDDFGEIFSTTKSDIIKEHNHNLYKAWQIISGIIGMTAILEYYLKSVVEKITGKPCKGMGILPSFSKKTKIEIKNFEGYQKLYEYYQVRHIAVHNLSRIDERFKEETNSEESLNTPYIYYPQDLICYRDLILSLSKFIENKIPVLKAIPAPPNKMAGLRPRG